MKLVAMVGNRPNHLAFCQKLSQRLPLSAMIVSENIVASGKKSIGNKLSALTNRIAFRIFGQELNNAWQELQSFYQTHKPENIPTLSVKNINDAQTIEWIERNQPDLVLVLGTNMLGKKVIEAAQRHGRILNLHTGISPYVKGGPNCTNWCLSKNWLHHIGNTVMWIDGGIDSGAIVATERTNLSGNETLSELHWKVMEHAHDLYIRVAEKLVKGESVPAIAQRDIAEGKTFYTRDWDWRAMSLAVKNFKKHFRPETFQSKDFQSKIASTKVFPL